MLFTLNNYLLLQITKELKQYVYKIYAKELADIKKVAGKIEKKVSRSTLKALKLANKTLHEKHLQKLWREKEYFPVGFRLGLWLMCQREDNVRVLCLDAGVGIFLVAIILYSKYQIIF